MFQADLTDNQIALLCEIGEFDPEKDMADDKKRDLEVLISAGYAEPGERNPGPSFNLTAKAVAFLGKRGVVEYRALTDDGRMRHGSFKGVRKDLMD